MVFELKNLVPIFLDRDGPRGHPANLVISAPCILDRDGHAVTAATIFAFFSVAEFRVEHSYKVREICQDLVDAGIRSAVTQKNEGQEFLRGSP